MPRSLEALVQSHFGSSCFASHAMQTSIDLSRVHSQASTNDPQKAIFTAIGEFGSK